jgi:VWFA-related protein
VIVAAGTFVHAQSFRSTVNHVAIPVTIQGELNEHPADLQPEDFRVFDDGRPVPIAAFGKVRRSVHVLLLLDTSRSMMESLPEVRSAANAVIAQLAPGDSIRVGTFSSSLRLSPPFSSDDSYMAERVPLAQGANMTILYDALAEGCAAFSSETEHRAIFVVSDGTDTASSISARDVMLRAAETNVAIYAVGLGSRRNERGRSYVRAPDATLREIAEDTGGRYVDAGAARDFSRLLGPMIEELHQQYILGFTPAYADGRLHSLVVTTRRANVKIRARKHYMAPAK